MSSDRRVHRMASLIRAELARVLLEEISDPRLHDISITEVELTKDLKTARVFFTSAGIEVSDKREKEIHQGFKRALPYFKRKMGQDLDLRYIPQLIFQRDTHGESLNRLYHLFDEVAERDDEE